MVRDRILRPNSIRNFWKFLNDSFCFSSHCEFTCLNMILKTMNHVFFFLSTYFTNQLISALNYNRFVREIGDYIEEKNTITWSFAYNNTHTHTMTHRQTSSLWRWQLIMNFHLDEYFSDSILCTYIYLFSQCHHRIFSSTNCRLRKINSESRYFLNHQ